MDFMRRAATGTRARFIRFIVLVNHTSAAALYGRCARALHFAVVAFSLLPSHRSPRPSPVEGRAAARAFRNVAAFEVTRRDISRTRASGGALAETRGAVSSVSRPRDKSTSK